jgi:hypothetical protein
MTDLSFTKFPYSPSMTAEVSPHLTAIATFRSLLSSLLSQYPESFLLTQVTQDDRACYRWLKARHFNPQAALTMITAALQYRDEHQLDTILTRPFPKAEQIRRLSQDSLHGYDLEGRPVLISRFGAIDSAAIAALCSEEERVTYHHYLSEYLQRVVLPAASARRGVLVDSFSCLFDMSGFSTAIITKANYNFVSSSISINSLLYPEAMGCSLIVNAPFVFSVGWSMVKAAIDEATRSKILIVRGLPRDRITALIASEQLPAFVGGHCQCNGEQDGCMRSGDINSAFESWIHDHCEAVSAGCEETVLRKGSDGSDAEVSDYSNNDNGDELQMIQSSA